MREELATQARRDGIGLATLLRDLATTAAREARRTRRAGHWRGDARPKEPNKLRPAFVVEDDGLFAPAYPDVILVPLTEDVGRVIPDLAVIIPPTPENGCAKPCWAASHLVTATSKARLIRPA